jgi:hypothetical protein
MPNSKLIPKSQHDFNKKENPLFCIMKEIDHLNK